jgi:ATP-binding cassette subfamily B protein/ATP-binding cassette subfamily C protein
MRLSRRTSGGAVNESTDSLLKDALMACRGGFLAVALFSLCINLLMLTVPLYMLQLFSRVLGSGSTDTLLLLTAIAGIALLTLAVLEAVRGQVLLRTGAWIDSRLGGSLLARSIRATLRHNRDPSVQALRDLSTFRGFLTGPAIFPVLDAPWTPIFLVVIFLLHPLLGVIALTGALVLLTLAIVNELTTRKPLQHSGNASIQALHQAEAAARNADAIEAMGMMPGLIRRWNQQNAEALSLQAQAGIRSGGIAAGARFVRLFLQIGMFGAGAWLVILGELTPGAMIAGSILMGRALAPVDRAIGSWRLAIAAREAYRRISIQLDETPSREKAMALPTPSGRLRVEGLAYVHPGATKPVLRNIAFVIEPGEVLGLIGPTATGKTTLARLLVGNLEPRAGHVRLDGIEIAQWASEDRGRHIGYLPQDVELFSGTVAENIARMGEGEAEKVIAAARLAGVHDMILHLPQGYDTEVGEGGAALSGGQRQRIALARALFGDPPFLVLDEPNASLDQGGEQALLNAIATLKARRATLVVIAHRPNLLRHTDKILVLRDGVPQMFGPRDKVLSKVIGPGSARRGPVASAEHAESRRS